MSKKIVLSNSGKQIIRKVICVACGQEKPFAAKGMCKTCYTRDRLGCKPKRSRKRACSVCGQEKVLAAKERCRTCYSRLQYARARGKVPNE